VTQCRPWMSGVWRGGEEQAAGGDKNGCAVAALTRNHGGGGTPAESGMGARAPVVRGGHEVSLEWGVDDGEPWW
jgi:hypothetical protein